MYNLLIVFGVVINFKINEMKYFGFKIKYIYLL